jgi:hypothetical protein
MNANAVERFFATSARRIAGFAALGLYAVSIVAPVATSCTNGHPLGIGFTFLYAGWMGALGRQFAWFANPLIGAAIALLLLGRRVNAILAAMMFALALQAFAWKSFYTGIGDQPVCRQAGFWFWEATAALIFAYTGLDAGFALLAKTRRA